MSTYTAIPSMSNNGPKTLWNPIENDIYEARIVKCIGLGMQEQKPYKGQAKAPKFELAMTFELIGVDATGVDRDGKPVEPRPACQFKTYPLHPGGKMGGVYNMVRAIDPSLEKVPANLEWFESILGSVINVEVGSYVNKQGRTVNCVNGVSPVPSRNKDRIGEARTELQFFNPYVDTPEMLNSYGKLFKFQRDSLVEALDSDNIPYAGKEPVEQGGQSQAPAANPYQAPTAAQPQQTPADMSFDDDMPF